MTNALCPLAGTIHQSPDSRRGWWPLVIALVYATSVCLWPSERLLDRGNYMAYLENAQTFMLSWSYDDALRIMANEPVWIMVNAALGLFLWPEQAIQVLIFVPAAAVAYYLLRTERQSFVTLLLLAFLLLLPQILKNHVIHLRQGLAVALFLAGWFSASRKWRWTLWILAPLVHSSFFFVLLMIAVAHLCSRWRVPLPIVWAIFLFLGVGISLTLEVVAGAMGARQVEEWEFREASGISGLGFLFWASLLLFVSVQPREFLRQHILEFGTVIFYVATYFLTPAAGRVFESTLLLVVMAGLRMRTPAREIYLGAIAGFGMLQWLMIFFSGRSPFYEY